MRPCDTKLYASMLPCCEQGQCIYGHTICPPDRVAEARAYYRKHGIGPDGKGVDRLRGTELEHALTNIFEVFPGTRFLGVEPEKQEERNTAWIELPRSCSSEDWHEVILFETERLLKLNALTSKAATEATAE